MKLSHSTTSCPAYASHPGAARRLFRTGLLLGAFGVAQGAHAQAIYGITEQASPSETLSVRGDGFTASTTFKVYPYDANGNRQAAVTCVPSAVKGPVAMFSLPSTIRQGVYEVVGATVKGSTNNIFVNRPRLAWSDVPDAMPDGLVRLVGRNFKPFTGTAPTVTVTNSSTRIAYTGTIVTANDNSLSFRVPSNAPAGTYKITLSNGLSGAASVSPDPLPLNVVAKANDPFSLGLSWGADYNAIANNVYNVKTDPRLPWHMRGDGTEEALTLAVILWRVQQTGGGTVYLPAGSYGVDDGSTSVCVPPGVVLKGDGKGQTILKVGYTYTATQAQASDHTPIALLGEGSGLNGISDLTIVNQNANAKASYVLRGGSIYQTSNKTFLKNLEIKLGNGRAIWLSCPRKVAIEDCDITSTCLTDTPIYMADMRETQFLRNRIDYRGGRIGFIYGQRNVFADNSIQFDNAYHTPDSVETGGLELSFGQQVLVENNDIGGYGPIPTKDTVDGELIMTQLSSTSEFTYTGMVKSVSSRTLVAKDSWSNLAWQNANYGNLARRYVLIVSGKGAGQWRWVTNWTSNTMTVDKSWQTVPDSTSRYVIQSMNNYQQAYVNNRMFGGVYGASIYDGAIDSVVAGNTQTNTGPILVRGACVGGDTSGSNYIFNAAWDVSVTDNKVFDTNGYMPGTISVSGIDVPGLSLGAMFLNVDVRRNTLVGCNLTPRWYELCQTDGIEVASIFHTGLHNDDVLNVGTIVQSNTISGSIAPLQIRYVLVGDLDNDLIRTSTGG